MALDGRISALEQQLQNLSLGGMYKDLSSEFGIKDWSGNKQRRTVPEFLDQVQQCATTSRAVRQNKQSSAPQQVDGRRKIRSLLLRLNYKVKQISS
jgi:hypothetical protein